MEEELKFSQEWLSLKKYHFKILTTILVLADKKGVFRGKLSDICKSLSIQSCSANNNNIKDSLSFLEAKGYISIKIDKKIYTISLLNVAENNQKIITIKRAWYKLIRETKSSAAWENVLKVFLVLKDLPPNNDMIITNAKIGEIVACSAATVKRATKTICSINYKDFGFIKEVIKKRLEDGRYITLGTVYTKGIFFE